MKELAIFTEEFESFGKLKHIQDMLSFFNSEGIHGREKWLQLEFAFYLKKSTDSEIYVEDTLTRDQRKTRQKFNRLDMTYRRPNTNTDYYNGVEFKFCNGPEYSIKGAIEDLYGVSEIKESDWCFRSVIAVAIYQRADNSKYITETSAPCSKRTFP